MFALLNHLFPYSEASDIAPAPSGDGVGNWGHALSK